MTLYPRGLAPLQIYSILPLKNENGLCVVRKKNADSEGIRVADLQLSADKSVGKMGPRIALFLQSRFCTSGCLHIK